MKIKTFLASILLSLTLFARTEDVLVLPNSFKQGIYTASEIKTFKASAKLVTPKGSACLIIIDPNGRGKFYKYFDKPNEATLIGIIESGDIILIVGNGEIAITSSM
jgi:hypothetical protein